MSKLVSLLGRLLCMLGFHDYRVLEVMFQFSSGGSNEKIECRRCGVTVTRQA
jgi:hypothetical protein